MHQCFSIKKKKRLLEHFLHNNKINLYKHFKMPLSIEITEKTKKNAGLPRKVIKELQGRYEKGNKQIPSKVFNCFSLIFQLNILIWLAPTNTIRKSAKIVLFSVGKSAQVESQVVSTTSHQMERMKHVSIFVIFLTYFFSTLF